MNPLEKRFADVFADGQLVRMIFSNKRKKSLEYNKVTIRPVKLSGQVMYQVEYTFEKKVTHENLDADGAYAKSMELVTNDFKQVNIFTSTEDIQILASKPTKPEKARITCKPATRGLPTLEHNKTKQYVIADGKPCDFLIRLGVMDESGKVIQRHYSKFRQINRYLEIVEDVFPYLPKDKQLKIIDFGCGKAYLTFALYYYLRVMKDRDVKIIGLDLKKDVIAFCSKVAADLGYDGLEFLISPTTPTTTPTWW